jgi:UDP-N-acetylmuramoylalanine--D-glutamate ligase
MTRRPSNRAKNIKRLYGNKIAVLGFEREGRATLEFLLNDPEFRGAEIWILDKNEDIEVPQGIHARLGANYLSHATLNDFDIIFRTPGIRYHSPEIQRAIKNGVNVSSATQLFFDRCPGKIIGVTGTKGKGTTSTLIYEILKAGGKDVFLAGNIGKPALEVLSHMKKNSWAVLELSSFQLIDMQKSPHIAVAIMVTEEHLDWHTDVKDYVNAKSNIVRFQSPADFAVLAEDYPKSLSYAKLTKADVSTYSRLHAVEKGTWVENNSFYYTDEKKLERVCNVDALKIPGKHNWENAAAAITVGKLLDISDGKIKKALANFKGLEHRLEFVKEVTGVRYYNDSYSTAPDATEVAVQAFEEPKVLIIGGSHKDSDFTKLGRTISKSKSLKAIIGIGVEWPIIKSHIKNKKMQLIEGCKNMEEIVKAAHDASAKGDVVILSPGCASFDMFKNYTDRGMQFKQAVEKLAGNR